MGVNFSAEIFALISLYSVVSCKHSRDKNYPRAPCGVKFLLFAADGQKVKVLNHNNSISTSQNPRASATIFTVLSVVANLARCEFMQVM